MFGNLKKMLGAKRSSPVASRVEKVPVSELAERPVTRALLLRAAQETDDTERWLKDSLGKIRPIEEPSNLARKIDSAVSVVTSMIVMEAQREATGKSMYMPGDPLPREAQMVVTFGFIVISGLVNPIRNEGHKVDFPSACASWINAMLLMHSDAERVAIFNQGRSLFQEVANMDIPNVREFIDNVMRLVLLYVIQYTTDDPKLKQTKFAPLFGALLKSFLSSASDFSA